MFSLFASTLTPPALDPIPFPTTQLPVLCFPTEVLLCCLQILRCIHRSVVNLPGAAHLKKADSLSPRPYPLSVAPLLDRVGGFMCTSTCHAGAGLVCCPNHCAFICVVSRRHCLITVFYCLCLFLPLQGRRYSTNLFLLSNFYHT